VAEGLAAGQAAGSVRSDLDPKAVAFGLETITLALLMASLLVPDHEQERELGVRAVFEALLRPAPPA
jgi:hypothetical protein